MAQNLSTSVALAERRPDNLAHDSSTAFESISGYGELTEFGPEHPGENAENLLAIYFKEMAALTILDPDEEYRLAQGIERLETGLWSHLLGYLSAQEIILSIVERNVEINPAEFAALHQAAFELRRSDSKKRRRSFQGHVDTAAKRIYERDVDRRTLFVVLGELRKIARGERTHVYRSRNRINIRSKAFKDYYKQLWSIFSACQRLRNEFVKANLRLVVSIARRFNYGRMPLNDLIQEGNLGLIKAVERYDYRRGYRFSTYASWWIRHAISRALADKGRAVRLPVHLLDTNHRVARAVRDLTVKLGRVPTVEEIGAATSLSTDKVERIQGYLVDQPVSLDQDISEVDDRRFIEMVQDPATSSPVDTIMEHTINQHIHEILRNLKPVEADVLRRRFGLLDEQEHTLKEIGDRYRLSRERIRQIQEQALVKVRRALELRRMTI